MIWPFNERVNLQKNVPSNAAYLDMAHLRIIALNYIIPESPVLI
jgi:hypothetical protein